MKLVALNIILFKIGWATSVYSAAKDSPWLGMVAVSAVAFVYIVTSKIPSRSIKLLTIAALIGLVWESAVLQTGVLDYGGDRNFAMLAPLWIVSMWILFATTLNLGFRWLKNRYALAALLGAIGGPLGFYVGEQIGAVTFVDPVSALLLIATGWAFLMPLLVYISAQFDGHGIDQMHLAPQRTNNG